MPADVPYNVDMTLAEDSTDTSDADSTDTSTEPTMSPIDESELTGSLVIVDVLEGTGAEAREGDSLTVSYTGYFTDGVVFDSGEYTLVLGAGSVIQGWEQGLVGMKVGGMRHLVIPPDLAYGASGSGSIPGDTTLAFEVELISINGGEEPEGEEATAEPEGEEAAEQ
jgi:FKBP-type peptidyl-prolyl cis-trans isomerase